MATHSFSKLFLIVVVSGCLGLMKAIAIVFLLMFPAVNATGIAVFKVYFLLFFLSTSRLLDILFKGAFLVNFFSRSLIKSVAQFFNSCCSSSLFRIAPSFLIVYHLL